jgi:hypothetical protein
MNLASQWTVEIQNLSCCGSAFEIVSCLRNLDSLLQDIDQQDRIKYCKSDFEGALYVVRQSNVPISEKVTEIIIGMTLRYFNEVSTVIQSFKQ